LGRLCENKLFKREAAYAVPQGMLMCFAVGVTTQLLIHWPPTALLQTAITPDSFPPEPESDVKGLPTCTSCRVRLLPGCQRSSQASGPHCCHCCCCHCCLQTCPLVPGWCPATVLQAGGCPGTPTTCTAQHSTARHSMGQHTCQRHTQHTSRTAAQQQRKSAAQAMAKDKCTAPDCDSAGYWLGACGLDGCM
jgi:hypothetical protein